MRLCMGCMARLDDNVEVCPHCGYRKDTPVAEPYYLVPGTVLAERYLVGKVLGYGGFGVTYIGFDMQLEKVVAIKEYFPSDYATRGLGSRKVTVYSGDAYEQFRSGLDSFISEAKRLAQLHHVDGVVYIYDCIQENDTGYIIMEYLDGQTVKEILQTRIKLPFEEAEEIVIRVLDTLVEVHRAGMIHRDIAPDNIFITKNHEVKLLDFGAARYAASTKSRSLSVILKPGYAPEEQYRSHGEQGVWTDVYGVGATFYRMVTGVIPQESLERLEKDELLPPSERGVEIPPRAEGVLMKSLGVRKADRYQTAEEFRDALMAAGHSALGGADGSAGPTGEDGGRGKNRPGLKMASVVAGAAVVCAAVALIGIAPWRRDSVQESAKNVSADKTPGGGDGNGNLAALGDETGDTAETLAVMETEAEAPAEAQTEAPIAAETEAPTVTSKEALTDPETEARTEGETEEAEQETEELTEIPMEGGTEAPMVAETEALTAAQTGAKPEAPTVPGTEAQTEAQTEALTEASTDASTDSETEAPTAAQTEETEQETETLTEISTEVETEAPTEAMTEAQTEAEPEAPTEPGTEAQTAAQTEALTEASTDASTDSETEAPTAAQTEDAAQETETLTEISTEVETEAPTEAMTAAQTEALTEPPTEPETEALTEPETECPSTDTISLTLQYGGEEQDLEMQFGESLDMHFGDIESNGQLRIYQSGETDRDNFLFLLTEGGYLPGGTWMLEIEEGELYDVYVMKDTDTVRCTYYRLALSDLAEIHFYEEEGFGYATYETKDGKSVRLEEYRVKTLETPQTRYCLVGSGLLVRQQPDNSAEKLPTTYALGAEISVWGTARGLLDGSESDWYLVHTVEGFGYISAQEGYTTTDKAAADAAVEAAKPVQPTYTAPSAPQGSSGGSSGGSSNKSNSKSKSKSNNSVDWNWGDGDVVIF